MKLGSRKAGVVGLERSAVIRRDYFCFKKRGGTTELMEVVSTASFPLKHMSLYGLSPGLSLCFEAKMEAVLEMEIEHEYTAVRVITCWTLEMCRF